MIEVRSVLTSELLGRVPGTVLLSMVGDQYQMRLTSVWDDPVIRAISLPVVRFRGPSGFTNEWACLSSDGCPIDMLRQIVGWTDAA